MSNENFIWDRDISTIDDAMQKACEEVWAGNPWPYPDQGQQIAQDDTDCADCNGCNGVANSSDDQTVGKG